MALWLVRSGKDGEHEARFFSTNRIYLTWNKLRADLSVAKSYEDIRKLMAATYPDDPPRRVGNWAGQVWAFALDMKPGDLIVVPRKNNPLMAIGEIAGGYKYDPAEPIYRHSRNVNWLATDVPRAKFDQDLLYSFGAVMAICQVRRNDAEKRVRFMAASGWTSNPVPLLQNEKGGVTDSLSDELGVDLDRLGRDQIARLIARRFTGHGLTRLVEAILQAQGYKTYRSPEGPDKGIDILAGSGPLGFAEPRICVQVKSGDTPVDHPTLSQLLGTMQTVRAQQGLLVSWAGFRSSVERERPNQFFHLRLWDADDLIAQLFKHYDNLNSDIRAELPLKRIWVLAADAEDV